MAVRGAAALLFGILALIWPYITPTVLVLLFGAYALVDGVLALVTAFSRAGRRPPPCLIGEGILGIAADVVAR
jgi:uncharacterized membrane protein HdeD (DUF308 family)